MKRLISTIASIFFAGLVFAQTQTDMNQRAQREYEKAERDINWAYQKILKEYSSDKEFVKNLKSAQRLWVKFRDAEVKAKYPDRPNGYYGSVHSMCVAAYMAQLTNERIKTLNQWLTGIPEGDACSGSMKTANTGKNPDTVFHLSNGKVIALYGYRNTDAKPVTFSEFALYAGGHNTLIDFWGAVLNWQLKVDKDTLVVEEIRHLPVGENFKRENTVWKTEKIYFIGDEVKRKLVVNRGIGKYNPNEIQAVLRTYETAKPGLDDSKMELANQLFVASISGNKKAREYFKEFKNKFGTLDGAAQEEYSDLTAMLALWDK